MCSLGTADCMALPLFCKSFKAESKFIDPLAVKADYSPKEWPAKNFAFDKSMFVSFLITL